MSGPHSLRKTALAWAVVVATIGVIAVVRPAVADRFHRLRVTADVYPFAPPDQMVVMSLGFRSALADAIFADVLVSYGLHFQDKRRFEFVGEYIDTINALDPTFREPYRFADTMLVMQPEPPRLEQYVKAREILLRGLKNRPYDTDIWLTAGQFLVYLAPSGVHDPEMRRAWRLEGAKILARACELASKNENIPYNCISSATLLESAGEREAAIESLQRLLAVTDDPEIEQIALGYLRNKLGDRERDVQQRRRDLFRSAWKGDLPFVTKDMMLIVGPRFDVARCAGATRADDPACAATWRDWAGHAGP